MNTNQQTSDLLFFKRKEAKEHCQPPDNVLTQYPPADPRYPPANGRSGLTFNLPTYTNKCHELKINR